ncbi:MAG: acetate--CoA ligase family protein, partial [Syntrophobacteria bacterium]
PMDLGDLYDFELFIQIVSDTLARPDIDGMLAVQVLFQEDSRALASSIRDACQQARKPVALCVVTGEEEWRLSRRPNFPMFTDPEEAVRALAVSRDFYARQPSGFAGAESFTVETREAKAAVEAATTRGARQLTTAEAFQVLSCYGLPLAPWAPAGSSREASARAAYLGFPVAMKVMSEAITHKSDVGGVVLNLRSEQEAQAAYERLAGLTQDAEPGVKETVVLVQKMIPEGHEVFVGGKQDLSFGPVVLFGLGGIYVEALGDIALRIAPVSKAEARKMLTEIRGARILQGVRGQPPADLESVVEVIQRISQIMCDLPLIEELDINPLKLLPPGQGCRVVDCRMVVSTDSNF